MDHEDRRGAGERPLVVLKMGPVGGADFLEPCAALPDDVRNPERPADLDQLPARDQDLRSLRRKH